jgi:hypothetical protein
VGQLKAFLAAARTGQGDFVDVSSSKYRHAVSRDVQPGFGCCEVGRKSAAAKRNGKVHIIQQP